jgi:hypothetical protein
MDSDLETIMKILFGVLGSGSENKNLQETGNSYRKIY